MEVNILSLEGAVKGKMELPEIFNINVSPELIRRAVVAENTMMLQPQGHYLLAGMQTTARYYGRMSSYRTGRHMGQAIRPRQKLGGGVQGKVRIVPSATKGKRAHPHLIEKRLIEAINKREYQKALGCAISATAKHSSGEPHPIIVTNEIEDVKKSKEMIKIFNNLKLSKELEDKKAKIRKGLRRSAKIKHYKKTILLIVSKEASAIRAARNIAGVDACTVSQIKANLLAPGGVPGRTTVWSEQAAKNVSQSIKNQKLK
jgi:large subunit ribosomal protein L4e